MKGTRPAILGMTFTFLSLAIADSFTAAATGPLKIHPVNPRYFADSSGKAVYLTGSHTWATIQERGIEGITPDFDYPVFLDDLERWGHSFIRLWAWEHATWMQFRDSKTKIRYQPLPYPRTGPGKAIDGGPKYDLSQWNRVYFDRLRERVILAGRRGFYVGVMLFQGFSIEQKGTKGVNPDKGNPWDGHPFNRLNNINGIDGDLNGNGEGEEIHTLKNEKITALQKAFIRKVIDTLNGQNHIIWEISNESHDESITWQYHTIEYIRNYEKTKPKQHPIWMSVPWPDGKNSDLFAGPADAVSPNRQGGYLDNPPAADGRKVVITDTDHIQPENHEPQWVWKSFLRGLNPIVMDYYRDVRIHSPAEPDPKWNRIRLAMGYTREYADKINLAAMTPQNTLSSTRYCLAAAGSEYLIYQPISRNGFQVELEAGTYRVEWFNPGTGNIAATTKIFTTGGKSKFYPPFAGDSVLYLKTER